GEAKRGEGAGNGGGAGSTVRLDHIAIDPEGAPPEPAQIGHSAQRASNQALDFVSTSAGAPLGYFARSAGKSGAGNHGVLARDPTFARVAHELRNGLFNGGSTNHSC